MRGEYPDLGYATTVLATKCRRLLQHAQNYVESSWSWPGPCLGPARGESLAGVDVQGATSRLGFSLPSADVGQILSLVDSQSLILVGTRVKKFVNDCKWLVVQRTSNHLFEICSSYLFKNSGFKASK